ncbi:hypothetical protein [Salinimicrobium sp. TH3]|uniref:hypothetical protein n=1 Tax=Salinimicrobium sp. TH3 TaxID=2997342 RepID=UPI002276B6BB|nr:hypothetical protein [Salinimicrobium sp. TH3]MCY2687583.1 hypothetical protein [Salinimicrobium sp. TH3]
MKTISRSDSSLQVQAQKIRFDSTGVETEVPMNPWLEIGLYAEGQPLHHRMQRIRTVEQEIKVTVPRKPDAGGIDPNHLMIDLRLENNMKSRKGKNVYFLFASFSFLSSVNYLPRLSEYFLPKITIPSSPTALKKIKFFHYRFKKFINFLGRK